MTESAVAPGNSSPTIGAVILAGGRSERFGRDKIVARLAGRPLIDHVLAAVPADWEVVVVGRPRSTARTVRWVLEDPPDGGPLAGVAAGVDTLGSEIVVVIAGDMPWVGRAGSDLVDRLRTAGPDVAAVVARDDVPAWLGFPRSVRDRRGERSARRWDLSGGQERAARWIEVLRECLRKHGF